MIKNENTTKLFYNEYALRIVLKLSTSRALEGRNTLWMEDTFRRYEKIIDQPLSSWRAGSRSITREHMDVSKVLFPELIKHNDNKNCKLRIDYTTVTVFTNDYILFQHLLDDYSKFVIKTSQPETKEIYDLLLKNPRSVIVDVVESRYIVSTRSLRKIKKDFGSWVDGMSGIRVISTSGHAYDLAIDDDSTLMILEVCISDGIRRIREYVTLEELRAR